MKNLLTVLKKLGKKMTGDDIAGTNLVTVVDDIAEKYTGGSGGGGGCDCTLMVGMTYDESTATTTLDKTWQEIHDALTAGKRVVCLSTPEPGLVVQKLLNNAGFFEGEAGISEDYYFVYDERSEFKTSSATGYPSYNRAEPGQS